MRRQHHPHHQPGRLVAVLVAALGLATVAAVLSPPATAAARWQEVSWRGLTVTVPASWPVLRMSGRDGCLRYDRPAVYLGEPRRSTCPPHLVGRTETVQLTTKTPQGLLERDRVVRAPGSRVRAVITSATRPALARRITESVAASGGRVRVLTGAPRALAGTETQFPQATTFSGQGFDACTARSLEELAAWYSASPYKAVNIYIGGASRGCAQPNLSASWVSSVVAQGWVLIPTYVGLQAPCRTNYPNRIDPAQAAVQGSAGADDAIAQLNALGLGMGNPVYFDMEAFSYSNTTCRQAVLDFLNAWTQRLHERGYASGVYGSAGSTIRSLVSQLPNTAFAQPDLLWIARWCDEAQLASCDTSTNDPEVPATEWDNQQRIRQYRGGHLETWGGYTINIDSNTVDAAVAPSQLAADGTFVGITGQTDLYRMAGGAPIYLTSWDAVGLGPQEVRYLSATQFASLPQYPADGTLLTAAATGRAYRVEDGAAHFLPGGAGGSPTITVDAAALDFAGTGGAWDHLVSTKPSVRTSGPAERGTTVGRAQFNWVGSVSSSAIASYDARFRRARWDGRFEAWRAPASWQATAGTGSVLGLKPGYTYCVQVRARNRAGQLSDWAGPRCLTRALDDRRMTPGAGWRRAPHARLYGGSAWTTTRQGATLSRPGALVARVGIVATTCPRCGMVRVRVDGKPVGKVNLAAPVTKRQQVFLLKAFPRERGTVTVTVISNGRKVQLDGLVLSRS